MIRQFKDFYLGMSFMTRLVPARPVPDGSLAASLVYFPVIGLVLGLVCVGPFYLGLVDGHPWVQAWGIVVVSLFATRGLHLDGLADVFDAWGSSKTGEDFWRIIKDSRAGAFGVTALIAALTGQIILFHELILARAWGTAAWCFVLGRQSAVFMAYGGRSLVRPGLGFKLARGADLKTATVTLGLTIIFGLLTCPGRAVALALVVLAPGLFALYAPARKNRGINGDFLGAAIVWGEIAAALALVLVR